MLQNVSVSISLCWEAELQQDVMMSNDVVSLLEESQCCKLSVCPSVCAGKQSYSRDVMMSNDVVSLLLMHSLQHEPLVE